MRSTKLATIAVTGLLSVTLAACGSDAADSVSDTVDSVDVPAPVEEATAEPVATIEDLSNGIDTAVTLDPGFLEGLTALMVTPGVIGSATLDAGVLSFPITGGDVTVYEPGAVDPYITGEILHDGSGLSLEAGDTLVELENFVVDPGESVLTGQVSANGEVAAEGANLFFLDGSTLNPVEIVDGNAIVEGTTVKLHPDAAALLRETFGVTEDQLPDFFTVGVAEITASTGA